MVFSFIGYVTQKIPVDSRATINVTLQETATSLNEVVVTAFGLEREAKSLTYATQSVGTKELSEARELNVMNSLQGKVAGLSINSSGGGVGAPARVVLRGNRSITGDNQPLYVVDGVPISGSPADLNPDIIESINVLKGPNAAALYGSVAQNGAIIIETKRARAGVVNISLNNTFMIMDPSIPIEFQDEFGQGNGGTYNPHSEMAWGPRMNGQMVDHWSLDPADAGSQYPYTNQPGNRQDVFQNGYNLASNLVASVGGEKTQAVFSYTFTDSEGTLPGNKLQRNDISVRLNSQLTDRLSLDSKISFLRQVINNQLDQGASNFNPVMQIYRMPPNIRTEDARNFEYTNADGLNQQNYWNPSTTLGANPYWTLNRVPQVNIRKRTMLMTSLIYDFTDAVSLMVRASYDGANNSVEESLYNNTFVRAELGRYIVGEGNSELFNGEFLLLFDKSLNDTWHFNANFGGNIRKERSRNLSSNTGVAMIVPNFFALSNTNQVLSSFNPGSNQDIQSLYGFGQIGWKNSIFMEITGRNDWSSTLPAANRSYFYPSLGLTAVISDLVQLPGLFTFLKLRGSWAQVGNSAPPFMINRTATFRAGGNNGFLQLSSTLPNTDLRPEKTISSEVGLDVRFFDNRLGLDITAYQTSTQDQLFTIALPVGSGAAQYFTNGGNVENKGIEMLLSSSPVQGGDFNWDLNMNFGLNRNLVKEISDERPRIVIGNDPYVREFVVEQGAPFGEIYSRGWVRDDEGRVIVNNNGMPQITPGRTVKIANFNPKWSGGISNFVSYKNFSASFLIEHREGGNLVSMTNAILFAEGHTQQTLVGRATGVVFGGNVFSNETAVLEDGTINNISVDAEAFWNGVGGRNTPVGEAFVEDATNTRLREFTLGYTINKSQWTGLPVSNMTFSLVGRNLFFLYRASDSIEPDYMVGISPDAEGFQSFAPPTTRSYGFNLKIDF